MKESELNKRTVDKLLRACPRAVYYKIADRFTAGIPDSIFTWNGFTSWFEFKLLDPNESIHKQLDQVQLVELLKLQSACHRAWVIAFRKHSIRADAQTLIYAPSALWHDAVPIATGDSMRVNLTRDLLAHGVAQFKGFDYDAVVTLVHATHQIG